MATVATQIKQYLDELKKYFEEYKKAKKGERWFHWVEYFRRTNHFCKILCMAAFDKETQEDKYLQCFGECISITKHVKDVLAFDQVVQKLKNMLTQLGAPSDVVNALSL